MNFAKFSAALFVVAILGLANLSAMELRVQCGAGGLWVTLRNDGVMPVQINRTINIGGSRLAANLCVVIRNKTGSAFPLMSRIDGRLFSKSDYITLAPAELVGRVFSWEDIVGDFALPEGEYVIKAEYEDQTGLLPESVGKLISNEVSIQIDAESRAKPTGSGQAKRREPKGVRT